MNPTLRGDPLPEAMADVQGGCDLSLTRGIILYRDRHEVEATGGRIEDIGIGLVIEGRFAAESTVVDLGSGRTRLLDLSGELVILDWAYEPTVEHVRALAKGGGDGKLARYCFDLALRVLRRAGYGPVTRSAFLRIGFRDICRDLDLHEETAIRLGAGGAGLCRIHLDYDAAALVVRTSSSSREGALEGALEELFPGGELRRLSSSGPSGTARYRLRFPLPSVAGETRELLSDIRTGLEGLIARFEPDRHRSTQNVLQTFGARDTLDSLLPAAPAAAATPHPRQLPGALRVH